MEWISVKERLPEKFTDNLCCVIEPRRNGNYCTRCRVIHFGCEGISSNGTWLCEDMIVTHWIPLPSLPKMVIL